MGNIITILASIQRNLKAPKNQYNKFGGYSYRSCEDILEALKPITTELGAAVTIEDEIVLVGDRFYIKATATLHYEEETISVSAYAREAEQKKGMDESQITGATSSYARKYALNGLFAIDDNKDADSTNTHGKDENAPTKPSKADPDDMGNLYPQRVPKPQAQPQTATTPQKKVITYEEALKMDGKYDEFAGYPLEGIYKSNPKNLNIIYRCAQAANDSDMLAAIAAIANHANNGKN